jgi:hexosaminidase
MQFAFSKATGRNINYQEGPSQYYMADGINSLTDGIRGTYALNKYWHGFSGRDMIATVDLGAVIPVQKMSLGCLQSYGDWVFMPQWVKFEISEDGINFKEAGLVQNPVDVNQRNKTIHDFTVSIKESARYIRVTAKVITACPKGHSGEGKPGWIFCDEIVVE